MEPHPLTVDIISTLPSHIIETILCLVSIKEAARTSILSKEWRYKWTKIPKLDFYDFMFEEPCDDEESSDFENQVPLSEQTMASQRKNMSRRCKLFYAIYQVLLMRQGPIHEFFLLTLVDETCVEIDHIISFLSRSNAVKKLELCLLERDGSKYMLPLSVFSWHRLTDLRLHNCDLNLPPTFNGFGSLTSLCLEHVYISTKSLLRLVSICPLLKRLTLHIYEEHLSDDADSTINELFKCLPMIEVLSTWSCSIRCFVVGWVSQELPTLLIHLKCFYMNFMSFADDDGLHFLVSLIRCSPNLENLRLEIDLKHVYEQIDSVILGIYKDIRLEHLSDLQIVCFANVKFDLEFLKFILARSPKLKKVTLWLYAAIDKNEESEMLRILLQSPPASPDVEIIVQYCGWLQSTHFQW